MIVNGNSVCTVSRDTLVRHQWGVIDKGDSRKMNYFPKFRDRTEYKFDGKLHNIYRLNVNIVLLDYYSRNYD